MKTKDKFKKVKKLLEEKGELEHAIYLLSTKESSLDVTINLDGMGGSQQKLDYKHSQKIKVFTLGFLTNELKQVDEELNLRIV